MSRELFARELRIRRGELGLSVVDAVERSGVDGERVARSTWRELEEAVRARLSAPVGVKIDRALDWDPGTSLAIFDTPDPEILDSHGRVADVRVGDTLIEFKSGSRRRGQSVTDFERVIAAQLELITDRLATLEHSPAASPSGELLDVWRRLDPADQRTVLSLMRRLASPPAAS